MPTVTTVLDQEILSATPTLTDWFGNCQYLAFQANEQEYITTGEFVEVAVALFANISPISNSIMVRLIKDWQDTIDNISLISLPPNNDCFPMRLLINPSTGFYARIFAISC
jgi:hypothetical protein